MGVYLTESFPMVSSQETWEGRPRRNTAYLYGRVGRQPPDGPDDRSERSSGSGNPQSHIGLAELDKELFPYDRPAYRRGNQAAAQEPVQAVQDADGKVSSAADGKSTKDRKGKQRHRRGGSAIRPPLSIWARIALLLVGFAVVASVATVAVTTIEKRRSKASRAARIAAREEAKKKANTAPAVAPAASPEAVPEGGDALSEGKRALADGKVAVACSLLRTACIQTPESSEAWLALVDACLKAGDLKEAWRNCDRAVSLVTGDRTEVNRCYARLALECAKPEVALAQAEALLLARPQDADGHVIAATALLGLNRNGEALAQARQAVAAEPDNPAAQVVLGRALTEEGSPAEAVEILRKVLVTVPGSPQASLALARAQRLLGDTVGAQKTLDEVGGELGAANEGVLVEVPLDGKEVPPGVVGSDPALVAMAAAEKAELLMRNGNVAEALAEYEKLATANPELYSVQYRFAELTLLSGSAEAARKLAEAQLVRHPTDASPHAILARVFLLKGLPGLAIDECRKAIAGAPGTTAALSAMRNLAIAQNRSGDHKEAVVSMQAYLKKRPDDMDAITRLSVFQSEGGDLEAGLTTLREAAQRFPGRPALLAQEALLLRGAKRNEEAIATMRRAIEQGVEGWQAPLVLASLLLDENRPDEALVAAQKAYESAPKNNHLVADTLAWSLIQNGQLAEAAPLLESALAIVPNAPRYHYHRAVLCQRQQDGDGAKRELSAALASRRQFPEREAAEKLLAELP